MPNAFNHSGYLVGLIGTIILGSIATYCVHLLVNIHYDLCKWKKVSFTSFSSFRFLFRPHHSMFSKKNRCPAWVTHWLVKQHYYLDPNHLTNTHRTWCKQISFTNISKNGFPNNFAFFISQTCDQCIFVVISNWCLLYLRCIHCNKY